MTKIVETRSQRSSAEISKETGISMPTLQRYRKLYQGRVREQVKTEKPGAEEKKLSAREALTKVRRARRHVTRGASASEIRKALGISKKDLDTARGDLALLGLKNKHP
jgi:hypothetical protein